MVDGNGKGSQKFVFSWMTFRGRRLLSDARFEVQAVGGDIKWEETKTGGFTTTFDVTVSGSIVVVVRTMEIFRKFFVEVKNG